MAIFRHVDVAGSPIEEKQHLFVPLCFVVVLVANGFIGISGPKLAVRWILLHHTIAAPTPRFRVILLLRATKLVRLRCLQKEVHQEVFHLSGIDDLVVH